MGLILDSSVVIAAERLGKTAYQMLETIGLQSNDAEIAISVVTVLELAHGITREIRHNGGSAGNSSSTICWWECPFIP